MFLNKYNVAIIIIVTGIIIGLSIRHTVSLAGAKTDNVTIMQRLPFTIEPFNPVSETRSWDEDNRTFYYFNWGLKPTSGYSLQFAGLKKNTIIIKATSPSKNTVTIQMLTYPKLLLSLPKGKYKYQVIDENNQVLKNPFKPKNDPLQLTVYLPAGNQIKSRRVLRDPYFNNEGKTTAQIAVEAMFHQPELMDYLEHEVILNGVSFSRKENKWVILLSESFEGLEPKEQDLLTELITKTVLAIKAEGLERVEVTTDPKKLPKMDG